MSLFYGVCKEDKSQQETRVLCLLIYFVVLNIVKTNKGVPDYQNVFKVLQQESNVVTNIPKNIGTIFVFAEKYF
jgi:hypothetical protein